VSRDQDDGRGCQAWCLSCQLDRHDLCGDDCHEDDQRQEVAALDPADLRPWRPDIDDATPADPT
jgi:hypothetical protein